MNEPVLFSDFYCQQCGTYLSCSHNTELTNDCSSRLAQSLGMVQRNLSLYGFLILRDLPFSSLNSEISNLMLEFFRSDSDQKLQFTSLDRARRGYCPSSSENFATLIGVAGKPNDTVEKYRIGPIVDESLKAEQSNYFSCKEGRIFFFPNNLELFPSDTQSRLVSFYRQQENLAKTLIALLELAYDLPNRSLCDDFDLHTSILTFNYYCSQQSDSNERIAEHTDVSMFTLVSELIDGSHPFEYQVLNLVSGEWETIEAKVGDVIVNVGDWLQDCSSGRLKSARHRVIEKPTAAHNGAERLTSAFFFTPSYHSPLGWPDTSSSTETVTSPISYSRWRKQVISAAMAKLKK